MTLLVISPDYASHLLPLASMALARREPGERVVVATGPATADVVASFGLERVDLRLGRGSNPGVIRAEQQPPGEDDSLRGFFEATRRGMAATLTYQAQERRTDLLWRPLESATAVHRVLERVRPDRVLVDHLAFSATLALRAAGVPYLDAVLGHPTALPVGEEIYGYPTAWPAAFHPDEHEMHRLRDLCLQVRDAFTHDYNAALAVLDPSASPVPDAFAARGSRLLVNYPQRLHDPARTALLGDHEFLEASLRQETVADDVAAWLNDGDDTRPIVYVSLGSFLSARADVLAKVARALEPLPVRVALATGSADPVALGSLPVHWLTRPFLPQIAVLRRSAVAVTHGGNNSVTEALAAGVPMLVLPFSTDQFAGAAAIERQGVGSALDPNAASVDDVRRALSHTLRRTPDDVLPVG